MNALFRIIDVNLNRSQEGLRVCEDITRFILNDKKLTGSFKTLRHKIKRVAKKLNAKKGILLLESRNIKKDIGKKIGIGERKRKNILDIFCANIQRTKESLRVLEEVTKLVDKTLPKNFKAMRFRLYELEKKNRVKLQTLLYSR